MTREKIDAIYNFLKEYAEVHNNKFSLEQIVISGGEPLLDENIDILNYILNKFGSVCKEFKLNTNGTLLYKQAEKINIDKIDCFQISIDGTDEVIESINHYKYSHTFEKILLGIEYIIKRKKNFQIILSIMLCRKVVDYLELFIKELEKRKLLSNEDISIVIVSDMNFYKITDKKNCIYQNEKEYVELKKRAQKIVENTKIKISQIAGIDTLYRALNRPINTKWEGRINTCDIKNSIPMTIGPEGNIYWCTCIDNDKGIIGSYYPYATFYENKIAQYGQRSIYDNVSCQECVYRYVCGGGCVLNSINDDALVSCGIWKNEYVLENLEDFF